MLINSSHQWSLSKNIVESAPLTSEVSLVDIRLQGLDQLWSVIRNTIPVSEFIDFIDYFSGICFHFSFFILWINYLPVDQILFIFDLGANHLIVN